MDVEDQKHYLLMRATYRNCVACVQYWIRNGVDVEKSRPTMGWAARGNAHEALAVLQAENDRKQSGESAPAMAKVEEEAAMSEDSKQGVDRIS